MKVRPVLWLKRAKGHRAIGRIKKPDRCRAEIISAVERQGMRFGNRHRHYAVDVVSDWPELRDFADGQSGVRVATAVEAPLAFMRQCRRADLVIIENSLGKLFLACLVRPFSPLRLVSVDLVLPRPRPGLVGYAARALKRLTLGQVDRFILYFKDTRGYQHWYGIRQAQIVYVPFKANAEGLAKTVTDSGFVLCAGRSRRDVGTFVEAMRLCGHPGILIQQEAASLDEHGTRAWSPDELPANVRLIIDEGNELAELMAAARLVVIPRFRGDINATGISIYLSAMALGKCVILSRGPGAEDLLSNEAVLVEPENPKELSQAIDCLFENHARRTEYGRQGKSYAASLGDERRLLKDVLRASIAVLPADTNA